MSAEHPPARQRDLRTRMFVIFLTSLLVLSACVADPEITVNEAAATQAPSESSATETENTTEPENAVETENGAETDAVEPLYELRGLLPLEVADVNSLVEFIEEETGRPFLRPPVIVAQSSDEFFAGLEEDLADFDESAEITVRNLQALGLTTQGVAEVSQSFQDLLASPDGVLGYYDPEIDEVYVPVDSLGNDDFRSLLVHELTHALDGQHANLNALSELSDEAEITGNFEPVIALQAVGEGRATAVQNRWLRANDIPLPDGSEADLDSLESVPPALVLSLSLPYAFGEQFIEGNGGPAETWDLLDNPPASSEEFLVPGSTGEAIIDVPAPPADGPILDESVFGAADLFVWLLGESLEPTPTLIFPTFTAIDGWAGGRSVLWGDDSESCVRIALVADSTADLSEIQAATDLWAELGDGRQVAVEGDQVTITSCAPFIP